MEPAIEIGSEAVELQKAINPPIDETARRKADIDVNGFQELIGELIARFERPPGEELTSGLVHDDSSEGLERASVIRLVSPLLCS